MSRNEKWLSAILLVALIVWSGLSLWESWIGKPTALNHTILTQLGEEIALLSQKIKTVEAAEKRVAKFQETAQLGTPEAIVYDYQKWLVERAEQTGVTHIALTPLPGIDLSQEFVRLPFSLSVRGSREQLLKLIADLNEASFPHRINSLRLEAVRVGQETLPGLRLSSELELVTSTQGEKTVHAFSINRSRDTEQLVRNLNQRLHFSPYMPQPMPRPAPKTFRPKPQVPPKTYQLIALVEDKGELQAWFYCQKNQRKSVLKADGKLGAQHSVLEIGKDHVILAINNKPQRMALGDRVEISQDPE